MRWFRKRTGYKGLEEQLRSSRPQPSAQLVQSISMRLERQASRRTPAFARRVALAAAMTAALLVVAGVLGGLSYAATATSHTFSAISHVFAPSGNDATQFSGNSFSANGGTGTTEHLFVNGDKHGDNSNGDDNDNGAHHQYLKFVFVCLHVPPNHPFVNITLYLPQVAANHLISKGLATAGACS